MRKIVVNNITYEYKVGKSNTVIKGNNKKFVVSHTDMTRIKDTERAKWKRCLRITPWMIEQSIKRREGGMKEFDYYSRNPEKYHDSFAIKRQLIEQIHAEELTTVQREEKLKNVSMESIKIARELNKPYFKESTRLTQEFWLDARESLGYHKWLKSAGVSKLENKAYEQGHSSGYTSVYSELQDLIGFLEDMRAEFKG